MKRTILLSMAGVLGAAALAISQQSAPDPTPDPAAAATPLSQVSPSTPAATPLPQASPSTAESSATKAPPSSGDWKKACRSDRFEGAGKFRGHGHWWGRRHRSAAEKLDRLLNLTDEQKEKVREVIKASRPKIKAIREEQWAKMRAARDETRQEIRALLTPAQQKVLDDTERLRENTRKLKNDIKELHETDEQS